jgi:hypothetical protein
VPCSGGASVTAFFILTRSELDEYGMPPGGVLREAAHDVGLYDFGFPDEASYQAARAWLLCAAS